MNHQNLRSLPTFSRIFPFLFFMGFIALEELLRWARSAQLVAIDDLALAWLYLPKAALTAAALAWLWRSYNEIDGRDLLVLRHTIVSIAVGILIFALWVNMDWSFATIGTPQGFDPGVFEDPATRRLMVAVRVAGAVLVVPIMEELFWRSFLLRYLIDNDFTRVAVGTITLPSFLIVSLFFGFEHNYVLAGIMAGVLFNLVAWHTHSIAQCILAHAVANLGLAVYVLLTGHWRFW